MIVMSVVCVYMHDTHKLGGFWGYAPLGIQRRGLW